MKVRETNALLVFADLSRSRVYVCVEVTWITHVYAIYSLISILLRWTEAFCWKLSTFKRIIAIHNQNYNYVFISSHISNSTRRPPTQAILLVDHYSMMTY